MNALFKLANTNFDDDDEKDEDEKADETEEKAAKGDSDNKEQPNTDAS